VRDDRVLAPSVCVSELIETLSGRDGSEAKQYRERLVVPHRLQGFSPAYFDGADERLFSYASEYEKAAGSLRASASDVSPFLQRIKFERPERLELDELVRFWNCPPAYLLNRRLGLYLKQERTELRDREPLELDALDAWKIGDPLIVHQLEGLSLDESDRIFRGKGMLPFGLWGRRRLENIAIAANELAERARARRRGAALPPFDVEIALDSGLSLVGSLDSRFPGGRVEQCYSTAKAKRLLAVWIRHLAACAGGAPGPSTLIERSNKGPSVTVLPPVEVAMARKRLDELAELYLLGQTQALQFVPESSRAHAHTILCGKSALEALAKADSVYEEDPSEPAFDAHVDLAFDHRVPPFDAGYEAGARLVEETAFHQLALVVFRPLLELATQEELE
jgi:exodeoxyribonuclease V gamma subunit